MYAYYKIYYWSYVEKKERTHTYIVIVHQDKHLLHTYTFKSGSSLVPSYQPALYNRHNNYT